MMGCDDAHIELECECCILVWEPLNSGLSIGLDNSMIETPILEVGWMSITLSHYLSVTYIKLEAHFVHPCIIWSYYYSILQYPLSPITKHIDFFPVYRSLQSSS